MTRPPKSICNADDASSGTCCRLYLPRAEPSCQQNEPTWIASAPMTKRTFHAPPDPRGVTSIARPRFAAKTRDDEHDRSGDDEARAGEEQRRNGLQRDADREIGRAPDEADRGEGEISESAWVLHRVAASSPPRSMPPTFSQCV